MRVRFGFTAIVHPELAEGAFLSSTSLGDLLSGSEISEWRMSVRPRSTFPQHVLWDHGDPMKARQPGLEAEMRWRRPTNYSMILVAD